MKVSRLFLHIGKLDKWLGVFVDDLFTFCQLFPMALQVLQCIH